MKHLIELTWYRDSKGYSLLPEIASKEVKTILNITGEPQRIIGNGGKLTPYRPLEMHCSLFREFADIKKTGRGVLDFVKKYGRLSNSGAYDIVGDTLQSAENMNSTLKNRKSHAFQVQSLMIESRLVFDLGKPTLMLKPKNLLIGLWLQLGEALADGRTSGAACRFCNEWFEIGPGSGRRRDAKFCSDEHRVEFNSRKRSPQ